MNVKIRCLSCNEPYGCFHGNTQIHASIIETKCPFCDHREFRNISKFLDLQTNNYTERYPKIAVMIDAARKIGRLVNNEGEPKKRK